MKKSLHSKAPALVCLPDRVLILGAFAFLCWLLKWQTQGIEVLGGINTSDVPAVPLYWPFRFDNRRQLLAVIESAITISFIGLFESLMTMKALDKISPEKDYTDNNFTTSKDFVALGLANITSGFFLGLPSFGGYGRSRLNIASGAKTPMSGLFVGILSLAFVSFFRNTFYYVPKCVLAAMISEIGISYIEELPHDIRFYLQINAWEELFLMGAVFWSTLCHSVILGIGTGLGISLLQMIYFSFEASSDKKDQAGPLEDSKEFDELAARFPGQISIIQVEDRLTFASMDTFKQRTKRIVNRSCEANSIRDGSSSSCVELPHNLNIIFFFAGSTDLDGCATQELLEMLQDFMGRGFRILFHCAYNLTNRERMLSKLIKSGIIDLCGGIDAFVGSYQEALDVIYRSNFDSSRPFLRSEV